MTFKEYKTDDFFAVYKPKGPTSHDIIQEIRRMTGIRKVGHAGTLDPLASGVLVIGLGREATKNLKTAVEAEKEYVALIKLGMESATDDEEGKKITNAKVLIPPIKKIKDIILKKFIGKIEQTPPVFSAVKISGKRAYKFARAGKEIFLKPRPVEIKNIKILKYKWPFLKIKAVTGPGVYIRSLARDIGRELKTGGYLAELERTRVGRFSKKNAIKVNSRFLAARDKKLNQ
ncbi:MAG: tRNA pseudouridine(55) synthase TruB [Patescibacteria group bacterium]